MALTDQPSVDSAPVLWVKPGSPVQSVAGAITSSIHEDGTVTLRAIGAGAVNQALKATVSARQHLAGGGFDMVVRPGMVKVPGKDNTPVTAMVLHCRLT